jgi:hypothetical protein
MGGRWDTMGVLSTYLLVPKIKLHSVFCNFCEDFIHDALSVTLLRSQRLVICWYHVDVEVGTQNKIMNPAVSLCSTVEHSGI